MKLTDWLDHCCRVLAEKREYPGDRLLVAHVKVQAMARRLSDTFSGQVDTQNGMVTEMIIKGFRQELAQIEKDVVSSGSHVSSKETRGQPHAAARIFD